jgi:hypothetical protein
MSAIGISLLTLKSDPMGSLVSDCIFSPFQIRPNSLVSSLPIGGAIQRPDQRTVPVRRELHVAHRHGDRGVSEPLLDLGDRHPLRRQVGCK